MQVRPFQLSDAVPVMRLWQHAVDHPKESIGPLIRQLSRDSDLVLVADSGEQIVGLVVGETKGKEAFIHRILVSPEYRNRGVGSRLFAALKQRMQDKGARDVYFTPDEYSESESPFFEWIGLTAK